MQGFNATAGEVLIGSVTSSSNVDVYVMTAPAFKAWSHQIVAGGNCTPASLVTSQLATNSYNFTSTIPSDGVYEIVVNNLSHSTVTAQVNANLATATPGLVTVVAYSTATQQMLQTLTQTSVQTMQSTGATDFTTLMVGVLVALAIAAIGYVTMKLRGARKRLHAKSVKARIFLAKRRLLRDKDYIQNLRNKTQPRPQVHAYEINVMLLDGLQQAKRHQVYYPAKDYVCRQQKLTVEEHLCYDEHSCHESPCN